jgi:hypothetical protein
MEILKIPYNYFLIETQSDKFALGADCDRSNCIVLIDCGGFCIEYGYIALRQRKYQESVLL